MSPPRKTSRKSRTKLARKISDSSFNINRFSMVSTPKAGHRKGAAGKLKTAKNPSSNRKRKLLTTPKLHLGNAKKRQKLEAEAKLEGGAESLSAKKTRRPRLPATKPQEKKAGSLGYLFRNDFVLGAEDNPGAPAAGPDRVPEVPGNAGDTTGTAATESDSVVVIDVEDSVVEDKKNMVESVGEDLLDLASGQAPPDTPRTILTKKVHDTIVLDDTEDDSPDIIVIEDTHKPTESIQEIASKYFTTPANMDFIPLDSGGGIGGSTFGHAKKRRRSLVNTYKRGNGGRPPKTGQSPPSVFNPNLAANFNFGAATREAVFNFRGREMNAEQVDGQGKRGRGARMTRARRPPLGPPRQAQAQNGPTIFSLEEAKKSGLRPIVIDAANVAHAHGKHSEFSVLGIELVIQYFKKRGHNEIKAFLPQYMLSRHRESLSKLETEGVLVATPSRTVDGLHINSHDDRMLLDYATIKGAVVITRDNYRDMYEENPSYRQTIKERLLMPTFPGGDMVMFPSDPLGKNGPSLDNFLKF